MPTAARPARALIAACFAIATLLASHPAPAAALEPPRPLPGYRPAFLTETDTRPWTDCLWASGAMLLDKWTNGEVRVSRQALRAASGDHEGGSTFDDLRAGFAKYGFTLVFSPDGGARLTWAQLLSKLANGAGAVVLGDDHALPRRYGRWDPAFWNKTGDQDNHAVYIERYDRRTGRVWLMDPLARGDWQGEWISAKALRKFVWTSGSAVYAAVTPTAKAAPFAQVQAVEAPKVVLSSDAVEASWSLEAPKRWRFAGADAKVAFATAIDPLAAAALSPDVPVKAVAAPAPAAATVTVKDRTLQLAAPLPTAPGAYTMRLDVTDRRFGRSFVSAPDLAVFVPGDRRATMRLTVRQTRVAAGSPVSASVNVANTGTLSWAGTWDLTAGAGGMTIERGTRLEARWVAVDSAAAGAPLAATTPVAADAGASDDGAPTIEPVVMGAVGLAPGEMVRVTHHLAAPDVPGRWALVVDVVDDVDGSYAALGSQPAVQLFDVVAARGLDSVR